MNNMVLSFLEMISIVATAVVLGITIYRGKKGCREFYTLACGLLSVCGFGICVIVSGLEKDRMTGSAAIWRIIALYLLAAIVLPVLLRRRKTLVPGKDAIIEAFDKMDIGVCYYDSFGRIVLCNEAMHEVAVRILGTRALNGQELKDRLESVRAVTNTPHPQDSFEFAIGERYFLAYAGQVEIEKDLLTELVVADVSDLKGKRRELEDSNNKLSVINKRLNEYGQTADTVIREKEILNAKIRVHDRFGDLLLTTKRAIEEKLPEEELDSIVENIRSILLFMKPAPEAGGEEPFWELAKTAESIGVKIHLSGEIPAEAAAREVALLSIRECLTNTVKHAGGHNLYVIITGGDSIHIRITNDGEKPRKPVTPGTGLSALQVKAEKAGGSMKIDSQDGFVLEINI